MRAPEEPSQGLSPRVRGSPFRANALGADDGSIPACAGEPMSPYLQQTVDAVYPRVCGGAPRDVVDLSPQEGLSPRVRGSLVAAGIAASSGRSIPACAGEPCCSA